MFRKLMATSKMRRTDNAVLAVLAVLAAPGCAFGAQGLGGPTARVRTADFALLGAPKSETEQEARVSAADEDRQLNEKALTGSFWGGVIVGSVGTAAAVGFGGAGAFASNKLEKEYAEGIGGEDRDALVSRGKTYNAVAITGATLAVTGFAVAAIAHGIDASRCGPRRRKRDGCKAN